MVSSTSTGGPIDPVNCGDFIITLGLAEEVPETVNIVVVQDPPSITISFSDVSDLGTWTI